MVTHTIVRTVKSGILGDIPVPCQWLLNSPIFHVEVLHPASRSSPRCSCLEIIPRKAITHDPQMPRYPASTRFTRQDEKTEQKNRKTGSLISPSTSAGGTGGGRHWPPPLLSAKSVTFVLQNSRRDEESPPPLSVWRVGDADRSN